MNNAKIKVSGKGWRLTLGETVIVLPSLLQCRLERAIQNRGCPTAEENSYTEVSGGSWCKNVYDSRTEGKEERGGGGGGGRGLR